MDKQKAGQQKLKATRAGRVEDVIGCKILTDQIILIKCTLATNLGKYDLVRVLSLSQNA